MNGDRYQVYIYGSGEQHTDPLAQGVSFYVKQRDAYGGHRYLSPDGIWTPLTEGTLVDEPAWRLPDEAYDALVEAVQAREGARLRPATEALVLREWLRAESDRVDQLITSSLDMREAKAGIYHGGPK